jgi:hypothetical protein
MTASTHDTPLHNIDYLFERNLLVKIIFSIHPIKPSLIGCKGDLHVKIGYFKGDLLILAKIIYPSIKKALTH